MRPNLGDIGFVMDFRQLVYLSTSRIADAKSEAVNILESARRTNGRIGVTGMLILGNGLFFQLLEGPPDAVRAVFDKISKDTRHSDVTVLLDRMVDQKSFGNWSMAWAELPDDQPFPHEIMDLSILKGAADRATHMDQEIMKILRSYLDTIDGSQPLSS